MPVSIVSNLSSQFSQSAIRFRNEEVAAGTQRLSSGLRVFAASEDPAAVAVATGLRIENAALANAQINAAGGVSMLQIADGSLAQIGDIAIRLKTLATQASSGNMGPSERAALDLEFQALKLEIDRIAQDTEFNGVKLLAGRAKYDLSYAHNAGADGVVGVTIDPNTVIGDAMFRYSYDSTTEQLTVQRVDVGGAASQTIDITGLLNNLAGVGRNMLTGQTLPISFGALGITLTLGPAFDRAADIQPTVTDNSGTDIALTTPTFAPAANGITLAGVEAVGGLLAPYNTTDGSIAFNILSSGVGGTVTLEGVPGLKFDVNGGGVGADGADSADLVGAGSFVDIYATTTAGDVLLGRLSMANVALPTGATGGTLTVPIGQGLIGADYKDQTAPTQLTYMVGSGVIAGQDLITVNIAAMTTLALGLEVPESIDPPLSAISVNVRTQVDANDAITRLGDVLTIINQARAQLGAQQSRLEFVGRNLAAVRENNEGARSVLVDANVPEEITKLTNDQAMMQVGVSMLGQANRIPQMLLEMMRQG